MDKPMTNFEISESLKAQAEDAALERARANPHWKTRHAQMEEIVSSRRPAQDDPKTQYATAIKHLDGSYKDLTCNPSTLNEFSRRLHAKAIDSAEKGQSMGWLDEGTKIGEQMRQEMGLPTSDERGRAEAIAEFKKARGLD